jgi:hypothetical protein
MPLLLMWFMQGITITVMNILTVSTRILTITRTRMELIMSTGMHTITITLRRMCMGDLCR